MTEKEIIRKWYKRLNFDKRLDEPFEELLDRVDIDPAVSAYTAILNADAGEACAPTMLFLAENMHKEYEKHNIDENLFNEMIAPIKSRIESTYLEKGNFLLGDVEWYRLHLAGRLFRIGRLWFDLKELNCDIPAKSVKRGDNVVGIHVPGGKPLIYEDCVDSIRRAKEFISLHFPDFSYRYMTCISWLLSDKNADLLGEGSNVLKFATLFEIVSEHKSDNIIRFVFGGGMTRDRLDRAIPNGRFQSELKSAALAGRIFYDMRGVIDITTI
jgi:hypothetical protein